MSLREQITNSCSAILFLLAILLQPIHQLEHLTHNHAHTDKAEISFINYHEAHCNLCDFNFTPTLELKIETIEIPLVFSSSELKPEFTISSFYKSELNFHKQLRAPPYNV
ncbi:hypothetical protein [Moheibacter sediminis]|uniref:Uncharacterized protein n=1 Tax=Moheibacter sediminis TaxID=1434700 RepID=A0A1W1Z195_9FLAO|nr:hypothetical protein [Moheibacter sediminis]SMC41851.1 hypothetical protein SAMN06296427_10273 [Moheibacter sediminis]